jgi:hypothetical protein
LEGRAGKPQLDVDPAELPPAVVNAPTVIITDTGRRGADDSSREREASGTDEADGRASRRSASLRSKSGQHKPKSKSGARTNTTRTTRHGSPARVLPLPQASERQQRTRAEANDAPEPLELAADPYDSKR